MKKLTVYLPGEKLTFIENEDNVKEIFKCEYQSFFYWLIYFNDKTILTITAPAILSETKQNQKL